MAAMAEADVSGATAILKEAPATPEMDIPLQPLSRLCDTVTLPKDPMPPSAHVDVPAHPETRRMRSDDPSVLDDEGESLKDVSMDVGMYKM